ncbi:hypothetical protein [Mycobacterium sp. 94-17]|uniref:hypothetical protein n=1 Tax=Mycobacterium sp. 94-17 TaxID=2986147 RepID=UPI002D1EBAA6|nr:hypothetical protein [Mycobacterium sp. 94-17]MEB4210981.1 hypothetical protein [Mycobacterium sp. 94-17]
MKIAIEIALPAEHQNVAGVMEHRAKLAAAATELGWEPAHLTDTVVQLVGGVPVAVALTREKRPIATALFWNLDADHNTIHEALAAICRTFDVVYATVDGVYVAAPAEAYGLAGCLTD